MRIWVRYETGIEIEFGPRRGTGIGVGRKSDGGGLRAQGQRSWCLSTIIGDSCNRGGTQGHVSHRRSCDGSCTGVPQPVVIAGVPVYPERLQRGSSCTCPTPRTDPGRSRFAERGMLSERGCTVSVITLDALGALGSRGAMH